MFHAAIPLKYHYAANEERETVKNKRAIWNFRCEPRKRSEKNERMPADMPLYACESRQSANGNRTHMSFIGHTNMIFLVCLLQYLYVGNEKTTI